MRLPARLLLTGAAVLAVASCSSESSTFPAAPDISGNPVLQALVVESTVDFVIPASGGSVNILNAYQLDFPAGSVCDPDAADTKAGYASEEWDASCQVAPGDVAVRATLKWTNGHLYADFQPALRFVPSKTVMISTNVMAAKVRQYEASGVSQGWPIGYTHGIGAPAIYDALVDPTLRTVIVGSTGTISRRIKHFSGYMIATGDGYVPCDPNDGDPRCVWYEDGT